MDLFVSDVLEEVGWPLGYNGHTACPVHQGDNKTAFHYNERTWYCFSRCGRGGNARQLRKELILKIEKPSIQIKGLAPFIFLPDREPILRQLAPSELLHQRVEERRQARTDKLIARHQYGCELVRMGREIHRLDPELAAQTVWAGMRFVENAQQKLDGCPVGM